MSEFNDNVVFLHASVSMFEKYSKSVLILTGPVDIAQKNAARVLRDMIEWLYNLEIYKIYLGPFCPKTNICMISLAEYVAVSLEYIYTKIINAIENSDDEVNLSIEINNLLTKLKSFLAAYNNGNLHEYLNNYAADTSINRSKINKSLFWFTLTKVSYLKNKEESMLMRLYV